MKNKHLFECLFTDIEILEEKYIDELRGLRGKLVKLKWQQSDRLNSNFRLYPRSVLENVIGDITSRIELASNRKGIPVYGWPFHPSDGIGNLSDISHMFTKVWMETDGSCWGHCLILDDPIGKKIQTLYELGPIGVSSRGFGTMTSKKMKLDGKTVPYFEINSDYRCRTPGDFVTFPSVKDASTNEADALREIQVCETRCNGGDCLIPDNKEHSKEDVSSTINNKGEKMKTLKELKEEFPEIYKLHEDTLAEKDKEIKTKDDRIVEVEAELETEKEKVKTLGGDNAELKKVKDTFETTLNGLKDVVDTALEVESEEDPSNKPEQKPAEENTKELDSAKAENEKLKAEIKKRDDANVKTKLEGEISAKVTEELAKDDYKVYRELIKKRIFDEEGNLTVNFESVDEVAKKIESINGEISATITEGKKLDVIQNTDEKGKIHPEGKTDLAELDAEYDEYVSSGGQKTFEEFKKSKEQK